MNNFKFDFDKQIGLQGEEFFERYLGRLSGRDDIFSAKRIERIKDHPVSGMDFYCLTMNDGQIGYGSFEVKSYFKNAIITYGSTGMPTVGFELWSNETRDRSEWTPGWLYTFGHAREHNAYLQSIDAETRVIKPGGLINLYFTGEKGLDKLPFAAVSFPDFDPLWQRLKALAWRKLKWNLDAWNLPPATNERYWSSVRPVVMLNMWNIPLADLADIAVVTIIEDGDLSFSSKYQTERYSTLKQFAGGRVLNVRRESMNLATIERLDAQRASGPSDTIPV